MPQIADDLRAPGEVGNEAAVHHVEVQVIGAGPFDQRDLFGDAAEIGGKQRRRDSHQRVSPLELAPSAPGEGFCAGSTPSFVELISSLST